MKTREVNLKCSDEPDNFAVKFAVTGSRPVVSKLSGYSSNGE